MNKWSGTEVIYIEHRLVIHSILMTLYMGKRVERYEHKYLLVVNETKTFRYVKKTKNFYDVLILNAGHMVPTDQPAATLALLERFIQNAL